MARRYASVLLGALAMLAASGGVVHAQKPADLTGCWRSDRPLGPTGGTEPVARDRAFQTIVVQDSGHVTFPLVDGREREMWARRSSWVVRGDSVILRHFTGLQGWHASLVRNRDGNELRGTARYLSDAIVVGAPPTIVPVMFTRVACDASWPGTATARPPLRPWQRDEPAYFSFQVDRIAAIRNDSPLPGGMISARVLGKDERAVADSASLPNGVARVAVQFVVEKSGRADSASAHILASSDSAAARRVMRALPRLRFDAAMYKGEPVHSLTIWAFDVRRSAR